MCICACVEELAAIVVGCRMNCACVEGEEDDALPASTELLVVLLTTVEKLMTLLLLVVEIMLPGVVVDVDKEGGRGGTVGVGVDEDAWSTEEEASLLTSPLTLPTFELAEDEERNLLREDELLLRYFVDFV
jgi:hypothetical protein